MIAALLAVVSAFLPMCPAPPVQAPVAVPYRAPACRYCPGHRGIEYATTRGMPVVAVAGGVVTFAGPVAGTRYVVVEQDDGLRATYGKLSVVRATAGQRLEVGTVVGTTGTRLYFGWRRTVDGIEQPIDPTPVLGRWLGLRRLLPSSGVAPRTGSRSTTGPPTHLRLVCPAGATGRVGR